MVTFYFNGRYYRICEVQGNLQAEQRVSGLVGGVVYRRCSGKQEQKVIDAFAKMKEQQS